MVSASATGPTTAHFVGEVTPPAEVEGEHFDTTWRFEYSTDQEGWTKVPVTDKDAGDGSAGGVSSTCPTPRPGSAP